MRTQDSKNSGLSSKYLARVKEMSATITESSISKNRSSGIEHDDRKSSKILQREKQRTNEKMNRSTSNEGKFSLKKGRRLGSANARLNRTVKEPQEERAKEYVSDLQKFAQAQDRWHREKVEHSQSLEKPLKEVDVEQLPREKVIDEPEPEYDIGNNEEEELQMQEDEIDMRMEEASQVQSIPGSYQMNIKTIATRRLRKRDDYIENLDSFLDDNLKTIAELINIKKQLEGDVKAIKGLTNKRAEELKKEEDLNQTLEHRLNKEMSNNTAKQYQLQESYKVLAKVETTIMQRREKAVSDLEAIRDKKDEIITEANKHAEEYQKLVYPDIGKIYHNEEKLNTKTKQLMTKDQEIEYLKEIIEEEERDEGQRLELVKDKAQLLNDLIKFEGVGEKRKHENLAIRREVEQIIEKEA